jgi:hypothetical protein
MTHPLQKYHSMTQGTISHLFAGLYDNIREVYQRFSRAFREDP